MPEELEMPELPEEDLSPILEDEEPEAPVEQQAAPQLTLEQIQAVLAENGMTAIPSNMVAPQQQAPQGPQAAPMPQVPPGLSWEEEQAFIAQHYANHNMQQMQAQMIQMQAPAQFAQYGQQIANEMGRPDAAQQIGQFLQQKLSGNWAVLQDPEANELLTLAAHGFVNKNVKAPLADNSPVPRAETLGRSGGAGVSFSAEDESFIQQMAGDNKELRKVAIETLREFKGQK
jgi:hypothetical protein